MAADRLPRWLALLLCLLLGTAQAHPMPESRVWVDTTPEGLRLTLQLPLNRLAFAYGQPLPDAPGQVLPRHAEGLSRYLLQHVGARSGEDGPGWLALPPQLAVQGDDAAAELQAVMDLRAPAGADPRSATLLFDAVTHEVRTHRVQVFLRKDWAGGLADGPPLLLGELSHGHNRLPVTLAPTRSGASLWRLFAAGALHIAEGSDHLLFLLLLLIVAPLQVAAGRWGAARESRAALRQLGGVVTAFTLGHSVTLAFSSAGLLVPPAQPVEIAVAVTIAIAAVHALRPLFGQAELAMAGGFGLVHGLAFAASLSGAGLTVGQHAAALLAFNLGIEAMQLALVALVSLPLWWLSHAQPVLHRRLRCCIALAGLLLALRWVLDRAGEWPLGEDGPLSPTVLAALLICLLWLFTAVVFVADRRRQAVSLSVRHAESA